MDVILHIGAHLCATTSFQDYMWCNSTRLKRDGIQVWGPRRTRNGLFWGVLPAFSGRSRAEAVQRGIGRIRMNLQQCEEAGVDRLIVSDAAIMGSLRANLRMGELYCGLGERLARLSQAFEGYSLTLALNVRALDAYWSSALSQAVTRGAGLPTEGALTRLADNRRGWRDVIEEISCAIPGADLVVLPYEVFGGRPEAQLEVLTGLPAPRTHARGWLNATPRLAELRAWLPADEAQALPKGNDIWHPFSQAQAGRLREVYADDMMWMVGGAGGMARLAEDRDRMRATGENSASQGLTRGRRDDEEIGRLAGAG